MIVLGFVAIIYQHVVTVVYLYYLYRSYAALTVRRVIAKMFVRVLTLVFLFLLKLRSPANKSVAKNYL